jgi:predicted ATPase
MHTRVVITGGPSAGKTTLLDLLQKQYGNRVSIAPEAASILFRGGFPRPVTDEDRVHTQRSIYALQREIELSALEKTGGAPLFCDRGSLDGTAYWHASIKEFLMAMGTSLDRELARYTAVIHLQTAPADDGYVNTEVRTETHAEATALDMRVGEVWRMHPNYVFIPNRGTFFDKLDFALTVLKPYLPNSSESSSLAL